MGWRDHLPVHPAADLFPVMSEMELRELGEDIKTNGLVSPLTLYGDKLLDGRNRLDAMELVGITLDWGAGDDYTATLQGMVYSLPDRLINPYDYVVSTNLHRRHLTGEQKRELIAKILKAKPEASNRKIAKQTKTDHKTVAAVRGDLESTGEIPQLEKTTGADGKQRKSRAKKAPEPIGSGSSEINVEQRKAEHARKAAEDVITVEDELEPDEYRESFLLRAGDAMVFAVYSGVVDSEVIIAAKRVVEQWQKLIETLTGDKGDIVEQCLSLITAMTKDQRAQFFAKYTELSAAKAPPRP